MFPATIKNNQDYFSFLFVKTEELSFEQLNDPDFSLKEIETLNKNKFSLTCSKCHHCK